MPSLTLFDNGNHRNILLEDFGGGLAVQANQHLIIHDGQAMILDPGGHKVYNKVFAETRSLLKGANLRYLFLSHQDPDIGTSLNAWLMDTEADALTSRLWTRFFPHFGIDKLIADRLKPIPDEGAWVPLGRRELLILPAHYLHSCGNLQVFDPTSRILFSGDLGAAIGIDKSVVRDFDEHRPYLETFHRRYMGSTKALKAWVRMV
ncbi:MAG: MBL fold metallo-hydrolase, partial [Myxococcales bacterium]|nr:MBL fold metallo-hydrolase [Myxococcales bacterium]